MSKIDEYLNPAASYMRLLNEYKKYNSLVIAYDFDNTVYDFHHKGETYDMVIELLRELKQLGCYLICFTANDDQSFVNNYLVANFIPFDAINENPPFFKSNQRKIYFNALLDDRAGLYQVYTELKTIVKQIKQEQDDKR